MERYSKANGYSADAEVIYGDTDSVSTGEKAAQGGAGKGGQSGSVLHRQCFACADPPCAVLRGSTNLLRSSLLPCPCSALQVMVYFGVDDTATAMKLGEEAAEEVSKAFIKPIKLEFEKVSRVGVGVGALEGPLGGLAGA